MRTADDLICAVLRGECPAWPWDGDAAAMARFHRAIDLHGVKGLLHAKLVSGNWPGELLQDLRAQATQCTMWELRHQQQLTQALAALDSAGIRPVLFKGTALAYSLYPSAASRARGDSDLIVQIEQKDQADALLQTLGYQRGKGTDGELTSYQASYSQQAADGSWHALDLHWKINNSELLSRLFTYEELLAQARPLPRLAPHAMGITGVHALLLACMHRATHKQNPYYVNDEAHHDANRLIWLYDIHLLAGQMTAADWASFLQLAASKGLRAVCLDGMRNAGQRFHTAYPQEVLSALARDGAVEPAARYLGGSKLLQQWMDFMALGSGAHRVRFATELFFPPAPYVRRKYPGAWPAWLPWLYLRRAGSGMLKSLRGRRTAS